MSVGAALAAYLNRCRTMVYIGGSERDAETGRVISGTEVVMIFTLRDVFENYQTEVATDAAAIFSTTANRLFLGRNQI